MKALIATFSAPEPLITAIDRLREEGVSALDAYMPFPLPEVLDRIGPSTSRIGWTAALAALAGGGLTYLTVYWSAVVDYPLNVGGRPLHSWPLFLPVAIVAAALWSGIATLLAMLYWCGLPRWHHPLFDVKQFHRASDDVFFLSVDCADPAFAADHVHALLQREGADHIEEVEL